MVSEGNKDKKTSKYQQQFETEFIKPTLLNHDNTNLNKTACYKKMNNNSFLLLAKVGISLSVRK